MKKVKNVLIKLELEGRGTVNMDSNDQKRILKGTHLSGYHENIQYAKKTILEKDEEKGIFNYKLKISDNCMMKSALRYDKIALNPNIVHHPSILYSFIGTPVSLLNGYLFPARNGETLKRGGALTITSAIQTCNAKSFLEAHSRSGEKEIKESNTDAGDTTFFYKETVGDITYSASGSIDLMQLQFVTCDSLFDRFQVNPDYFPILKQFLIKNMPNFNADLGYYQLKDSSIKIPEYGFELSNENVLFLTKEALKRLLLININKKGGYARISSLKIKLVTDPLNDVLNNDNGWIDIKSGNDVDNLEFNIHRFYEEVDLDVAKKEREEFEATNKLLKEELKKTAKADADKKNGKSKKSEDNE